jgi:hypothetical protein
MSTAGVRSNRGDTYQTLVALDWALTILFDPDFQWIEIDSVSYLVDDIVIGKTDGTLICCQCKKNQEDYKSWTITDLADELGKAARLLDSKKKTEVRFYSRSPFGKLAKLREHSTTQADEAGYRASLGKELQKIDEDLTTQLARETPHLSTYDFLRRTIFETSDELDRMKDKQKERLRVAVCNPDIAYDSLWTRLDQLGARLQSGDLSPSAHHRLTKDDLKTVLDQAGAMPVPIMNLSEVRVSFANTSVIGRTWRREIAGQRITISVLDDLLAAIDDGRCSILLTGLPGSGKTCAMLALQEALEKRAQTSTEIVPLFIQSREYADLATAQDRQAQGLPEQWVEQAARMSEEAQVVVVIDSLDVLSNAREHSVLKYFLAQIDRLLLIPNITVVTACRDFDRHYDRRIAERQWDYECNCSPFTWETEVEPLLDRLSIDTTTIDAETRELIQNPRELALFVELAQQGVSFNGLTSQALAQRYLDTFIRDDDELGETATKALEAIADDMLMSRKLAMPHQRFNESQDIKRKLCSLNVLRETQCGELTLGHQTLLDVLVVSGAIRRGLTLNDFIQSLPPVPFVRPSIRGFFSYLATGERRQLRTQLRMVLTGSTAFHIRRLVAESLAEQIPQDDDWPLIRELLHKHRDVFQVVYTRARLIEWHQFWLKHLVPVLKESRDAERLTSHAYRVSQWINDDTAGVLAFWNEILLLEWMDGKQIVLHLAHELTKIETEKLALCTPFVERLLSMTRHEPDFLGRIVARLVTEGAMDDIWLWRYIAGDIREEDVVDFRFGNKLHCQSHEFGESHGKFLLTRMAQSKKLLNLALESIENWSRIKSSRDGNTYKGYYNNFLWVTSYETAHSQRDIRGAGSKRILFKAIETSIIEHAKTDSEWWQANRERLCFNHEGALRYFAIRACTTNPEANVDLIGRILRDKDLLESGLSFEMGTLMHVAFVYLDAPTQDAVTACILTLREDKVADWQQLWILKERAELVAAIPCYLRSPEAQRVLDDYEKSEGVLIRQPKISSRGGMIRAPFSFEVFHSASDSEVLRLLAHYSGYKRDFDDFPFGGEQQVSAQLSEASSRHPNRFLRLLSTYWTDIPEGFRDGVLGGVANYIAIRYGDLNANGKWEPVEEPDASSLVIQTFDELERHFKHWRRNHAASRAINACAHAINEPQNAARLVFLAIDYASLKEESTIKGDTVDLINEGINMMSGRVAEALMILANRLQEQSLPFPALLSPTLRRFAGNEHPAVRALILRQLPVLQYHNPPLGWDLFDLAMRDATGLWQIAEPCLYYAYHKHFVKVESLLARIQREGTEKDMETWGRISALAALVKHIDIPILLNDLKMMDNTAAWRGAASVWTYPENIKQNRVQCLKGIEAGLKADGIHSVAVAEQMEHLFLENNPIISVPIELIHLCFAVFESDSENKRNRIFGFDKWLNVISHSDPDQALAVTEIYLAYVNRTKSYLYDHENNLTQLMTRLFAEAEEREESDHGAMLQRVVSLQDMLLSLGLDAIDDWLKAAERP